MKTLPRIVSEALGRGWSVIPIGSNKKPIINAWKPSQTTAATRDVVRDWASFPDLAGWSVITGKVSGVVVIDFDGESGLAHLEAWGVAPHVRTPSKGAHVYTAWPGWPVK